MRMTLFGQKSLMAALLVLALAAPAVAAGKPALRDLPQIDDRMLWVAIAIEISDRCDSIDPRTVRGLSYLWNIRSEAQKLGYSNAEIKAYVDSDAEKARMRARGEDYVRAQGLNPENDADLCKLGQAEIAKGSQIGAFLRMK
ncbi:MAG: DUF5333 domain-containing protein [Paracoccaceae bacterium]|jgi:hypothetical protein|uniref:DUF5333 domain-containing protein n=1 Tax=unclassified Seohaeicola TaxID=2641111 RepID=UPI00237A828D|nr:MULTISPECIES: DUF5333 domain-containing protein [unclassified Seohaeicola]MDD9708468.1 DUF5333 domain-containing protein [Seohaeicola sp. 4SK31]MDD9736567.1 DUF5333 domain-containing protein [Seohaeicola sp. SP36]MDF1709742.1 DUF5333 domain-containing protein [Paracoccaceae bacterium]MDM7970571.1 DUF5333 domain-containing protein [Paracoccaceae bacterium]